MLARAFAPHFLEDPGVIVYAAGVSNSGCRDEVEFARDRARTLAALENAGPRPLFVYFSTCSVADPELSDMPYVVHKRALERVVAERDRHLILRLPQVAGRTPNPHTLLNFLHARISRSERFSVWARARRNVIDADDVARIAAWLIREEATAGETINVAATCAFDMLEIVAAMERVTGKRAIYDLADRGSSYAIDVRRIAAALSSLRIHFGMDYLESVLQKYPAW